MRTVQRVLAIVVLIISILVLLLSLAGIAGTWIVRARVYVALDGFVTAAQVQAESVQQGMDRLDTTLTQAHEEMAAIEQQVQTLGADLEQNQPLLTAISDRLGLELSPLVDRAREIVTTIRETIAAVNGIIEGINALPFVTKPVPELEVLTKLSQEIDSFEAGVQALRATVNERQSEIVQGAVALITTPISQIGNVLSEMQTSVSGVSQQLGALQEGLSRLRLAIGRTLVWGAVGLTLVLLWLALSQAGLALLGWRAFLGQGLLPQRRGEPEIDSQNNQ